MGELFQEAHLSLGETQVLNSSYVQRERLDTPANLVLFWEKGNHLFHDASPFAKR